MNCNYNGNDQYNGGQTDKQKPNKEKGSPVIRELWLNISIVILTLIIAFIGAFFGMAAVIGSTSVGDVFLSVFDNNPGVKIDSIQVDGISGQYTGDRIELSNKVLEHTVLIRVSTFVDGYNTTAVSGSGIILDYKEDTGETYIVTNHHVVYGAEKFHVETYSGKRYDGEVLALDEICDIAVVKIISEEKLTPVTVADSDNIKAGQDIIAAGNPRGLGFSVSFGYVSHPYRDNGDMGGNLIQMDISVNPGNSGGGAYDAQGNLLGVVVSKEVGDNVDGIGYAIPANRMLSVVGDLMKYGYVKGRASLGVSAYTVTATNYSSLAQGELNGFLPLVGERNYGLYVESSTANIITQGVTLLKGDRIVSADGIAISSITSLRSVLARLTPYSTIELVIERVKDSDGVEYTYYPQFTVSILLGERNWSDEK